VSGPETEAAVKEALAVPRFAVRALEEVAFQRSRRKTLPEGSQQ